MKKFFEYLSLLLLCASTILLVGLQLKIEGFILLLISVVFLLLCNKRFRKDLFLIHISIGILGITPITTDVSYVHALVMGSGILAAVGIPYVVSRLLYKDHLVSFHFDYRRKWYKKEFLYITATAVVAYFLIPFYLHNTGAYINWRVEPGISYLTRFFIGINALGVWDELFFISTVLGILKRHMNFALANLIQAVFFSSFLYELGFTGWGFIMIYLLSIIQGYIYQKTGSLFYVITIHLTLDIILFLALINAHHPTWVPIFLVK